MVEGTKTGFHFLNKISLVILYIQEIGKYQNVHIPKDNEQKDSGWGGWGEQIR